MSILETAQELIHGDRNEAYGHPRDNFQAIADLWSAYLYHRPQADEPLAPIDVANLMILLKTARVVGGVYHQDSYTDIAGYAGTAERLQEPYDPPEGVTFLTSSRDVRSWRALDDVPKDAVVTDKDGFRWEYREDGWAWLDLNGCGHWIEAMDTDASRNDAPYTEVISESSAATGGSL